MQIINPIPFAALGMGAAFTVLWGVADPVAAFAEVRTYTGVGVCTIGDIGTPAQAKNFAKEKALLNAREQAGVYLAAYTRTSGAKLAANEISAITNNITSVVGEVKYSTTPGEVNGQPVITYTATLSANVDTEGIKEWLKRDERDKSVIISQNEKSEADIRKNLDKIEDLNRQYNQTSSKQERERIRNEYNETDNEFLAVQKLAEGNELYYKGDYDGAIRCFSEAIGLNPQYAGAYNNRGNAYGKKGYSERALADHSQAIAIDPKHASAYYNRGNEHYDRKEYNLAIADHERALALKPGHIDALNNCGNAYQMLGDRKRAIAYYNKCLSLNPDYAKAYYNRGKAYYEEGEYDKAIADYNRALAINSNDENTYIERGNAYSAKGESDRALADYSQALKINPNSALAYYNRGEEYQSQRGDLDRAIAEYDKAIAIDPNYANAYFNRGLAYGKKGDYNKALADAKKCLQLSPDDEDAKKLLMAVENAMRGQ